MKTIKYNYFDPGCFGKDCVFYGEEFEDVHLVKEGYHRSELGTPFLCKEDTQVIWCGHHCLKNKELGEIRQAIYNRAQKASDEISYDKYKNLSMSIRKKGEAFDNIANEWRNFVCPFYEK